MGKEKISAGVGGYKKSAKSGRFSTANPGGRSHTTKITTKGQITVPKPIREHLKLAKGDRIEFLIGVNGKVTIMPPHAGPPPASPGCGEVCGRSPSGA